MKLRKREKILLCILAFSLVSVVYYKYVFTPQFKEINQLKSKIEELENAREIGEIQASSENNIYKEFKVINSKISLITKRFYPSIVQEKIILQLDDFIKRTGVVVSGISFTEPDKAFVEEKKEEIEDAGALEKYVDIYKGITQQVSLKGFEPKEEPEPVKEEVEKDTEEDQLKEKIEKMTASINFVGDYEKLMSFIGEVEGINKNVIINSMSVAKGDENKLQGNISLDYYALPQINSYDTEYLEWNINNKYGKDNPFVAFEGYFDPFSIVPENESTTEVKKASENSDFYIGVYPVSADIPSVIIGKANDYEAKTYVYGDNADYENVEVQIIKENGKYYYKYKTEIEGFPKDYENSMEEFIPNGDNVLLTITSIARKDASDMNGIRLSIINKSDLELDVVVKGDDEKIPRVKIVDTIGKIVFRI